MSGVDSVYILHKFTDDAIRNEEFFRKHFNSINNYNSLNINYL